MPLVFPNIWKSLTKDCKAGVAVGAPTHCDQDFRHRCDSWLVHMISLTLSESVIDITGRHVQEYIIQSALPILTRNFHVYKVAPPQLLRLLLSTIMDIDIDEFYSELDACMNAPDEDSREYLQRVASYAMRNSDNHHTPSNIRLGNVIEPAAEGGWNANSTCKPRDEKSEHLRSDNRNRVEKRQMTPQSLPIPKRRKTSVRQVPRDDHFEDTACIHSSDFTSSNGLLLSSRANHSADVDCPQHDSRIIYNEDSVSLENAAIMSSHRYAATLPEHGDQSSDQVNAHDTIISSSPEPAGEVYSTNSKRAKGSYPQAKQFDSRMRSPCAAPSETLEQPSPITSFQTTLNVSTNDLMPKKPVVAKPAAIDFLPLDDPKTKRSSRSKGKLKSSDDGNGDPPTSPIEDPSVSSVSHKPIPVGAKSSLYLQLREKVAQHESKKKQAKLQKLTVTGSKSPGEILQSESKDNDPIASAKPLIHTRNVPTPNSEKTTVKQKRMDAAVPARGSKPCINKSTSKILSKVKATKKEKEKNKMLPHEYAQWLVDKYGDEPPARKKPQFLEGKNIFYTGGDYRQASEQTRARMELIIKHGGILSPKFDPFTVTHIIACCPLGTALDAMGLKHSKDIPDHIPTVIWDWVADAIGVKGMTKEEFDEREIFTYAAFSERIDAGLKKYQRRTRGTHSTLDNSRRKENNDACALAAHAVPACSKTSYPNYESGVGPRSSPVWTSPSPSSPVHQAAAEVELKSVSSFSPLPATTEDDPLVKFYAQAIAEHDAQTGRLGEEESDDNEYVSAPVAGPPAKSGWTCDQKRTELKTCPNQDIIDKLEELKILHDAKPGQEERWRVFTYSKCIPALRNYPKRIRSFSEASSIRGVGEKTAQKIMEIIETGNLTRINYEKTGDVQVTRLFTGIYGVGQPTAYKWYATGCRTLEDLRIGKGGVKLSPAQEIGLRFYDDINDRMPRTEAKAIFDLIKPIALSIDPKLFVEIMGSYRRGKADCGDIDILITRKPEGDKTHAGVLSRLLQELHAVGILTEDLAIPEHPNDLETIYRGLCRFPTLGSRRRRIDFLTVPWQSRGAALLYYTGDDIFNRAIRLKANALGYSLNQRGLFKNVIRDPRDRRVKLNTGIILASETEQEIFETLGVPWQEPRERVRR